MEQITKHCAHCGQDKPVTEFYRDKHTRDGLQSWCKECSNSRNGNRRAIVSEINWEHRRYEIARTILPYCADTTRAILMSGHGIGTQYAGMSIHEAVSDRRYNSLTHSLKDSKANSHEQAQGVPR